MRIGIDGRLLVSSSNYRGMASYTFRLLDYLIDKQPDNEYFLFVHEPGNLSKETKNPLEPYLKYNNFKVIKINGQGGVLWEQLLLPLKIKSLKIDVMHMPANRAPYFCPCKLVVTVHDLIELIFFDDFYKAEKQLKAKFRDWKKGCYIKFMYKKVFPKASHIITVSENSKSDLMNMLGIPEQKITVIYHGYDKSFKQVNFSKENYILCLGSDKNYKNTVSVIKAYRELPGKLKRKFYLKIVGDYPCVREAAAETEEPNIIVEKTDFTTPLTEKYNKARIFVLPSFYEGFGMPAVEAMACGTPVIASNRAALPEIVKDAGIIVDPSSIKEIKNAMLAILIDEPLTNKLIYNGLLRVKDFSTKFFGEKHYKIYNDLS